MPFSPAFRFAFFVYAGGTLLAQPLLAYAVYRDANDAGSGASRPLWWTVGTFLFPAVVAPPYFYMEVANSDRNRALGRGRRLLVSLAASLTIPWMIVVAVSPPDPVTQVIWGVSASVLCLPVAYGLLSKFA